MNRRELIRRRTQLGLTQQQVASAAGMQKQHYKHLEDTGKPEPRKNTLKLLALVLNCGIRDLLDPAPEPRKRRKPRKG